MYEFMERLIKAALPRIRDFRGVSPKAFDGNGNYTLGVNDQSIFPEVELDKIKRNIGFDVTIVTTARTTPRPNRSFAKWDCPSATARRSLSRKPPTNLHEHRHRSYRRSSDAPAQRRAGADAQDVCPSFQDQERDHPHPEGGGIHHRFRSIRRRRIRGSRSRTSS